MVLRKILDAKSVAIVGASKNETKRGCQAIRILIDEKYEGKIYPVNPKEDRILGYPCYHKVSEIEDPVDIVLITTPAKTIPAILEDCGKKGVKGAVVVAGGFGELGLEGRKLEDEVVEAAQKNKIRIIGPNTSGMINLKSRMNLVGMHDVPRGDIALLCQSGNMALTLIMEAKIKSLKGFSYYIGVGNEADIRFHEYLEFFHQDPDTKAILMYVEGMREGRKFLQQAYKTTRDKPIILHSLYASKKPHALELLRYYDIPVYDSLDVSCKCMAVLAEYGDFLKKYKAKTKFFLNRGEKARSEGRKIIRKAGEEGRNTLFEHEAKRLLHLHGAPECKDVLAKTEDEAVAAFKAMDGEVVMKIVSPNILHKSDVGGIRLHLDNEEAVCKAFKEIIRNAKEFDLKADVRGVLVAPMAEEGLEVIIGTKIDDQFGPVVMYGLGGIMVEILKDVSFRVLPISYRTAKLMIRDTKSYPILNGVRGRPPGDEKALRRLLLTVSELIEAYPDIQEMDLNPVIVYESGLNIADARVILKNDG